MKISIIVTVYNRFEYVENILKCLINQTLQPYEVIFTDDGSKEDLKEILKKFKEKSKFKIKHIYQKDLGFRRARACNNAILEAKGDYIISLDQDAIFPNNLVETFIKYQKRGYFNIMRVIWSTYDEMLKIQDSINKGLDYKEYLVNIKKIQFIKLKKWIFKDKYNNLRYRLGLRDRGAGLMGIGFGIYKDDLLKVNGYDEEFKGWGGEDADLGLRLYYSGLKSNTFTTVLPAIHMCHPFDPTKISNKDNNKSMYEEKKNYIIKGQFKCEYGIDNRKDKDVYIYEEV